MTQKAKETYDETILYPLQDMQTAKQPMIQTEVMLDASEVVHYDEANIPLYIKVSRLSLYPDRRALCHWHDDLEFIYVLDGEMKYDINGKSILLKSQDAIMVNSRQMHYGYAYGKNDCTFIVVLFHPMLCSSCHEIYRRFLKPMIENENLEYMYLDASMKLLLEDIVSIRNESTKGYELNIIGLLHILMGKLYQCSLSDDLVETTTLSSDILIQKKMVSFIYQNYTEKITLNSIADAGSVCRSKCCKIFKQYLQQSPIDFLNSYRMKVSRNLLRTTDMQITDIALSCGFQHVSYYSELFMRYYQCTPREYRMRAGKQ